MFLGGVRVTMIFLPVVRKFTDVMALAGGAEDKQAGRQREAGLAKKKSHKTGHTKRLGLDGARTISSLSSHPERSRGTPWNIGRHATGFLDFARNDRQTARNELKGLSLALL